MENINSDKEAIEALGLSESEIADWLGKTRQAINIGLSKQIKYFKPHELSAIYTRSVNKTPESLQIFRDWATRTERDFDIFSPRPHSLFPPEISISKTISLVFPSYYSISAYRREILNEIKKNILNLKCKVFVFMTTKYEENEFHEELCRFFNFENESSILDDRIEIKNNSRVNSWPDMLFLHHDDGEMSAYVLSQDISEHGRSIFSPIDPLRGRQVYASLMEIFTPASIAAA